MSMASVRGLLSRSSASPAASLARSPLVLLLCLPLAAIAPRAARAQCDDATLTQVAAELVARPDLPGADEVLAAVAERGSDAPVASAARIPAYESERFDAYLARARLRFGAHLACGEAQSEGTRLVIVTPAAGHLEPAGESGYRVRLQADLREARVVARSGEGGDWQRLVRAGDLIELPDDLRAPWILQLVASDETGPHPVAVRRSGRFEAPADDDDTAVLERVEHLREAGEVRGLRRNRRLSEVAQQHAEAICARARIGHEGEGGDPERRLARSGIQARHVGESVARAASRSAAWRAMLESPSHRAALLDHRFTDVGSGEARVSGRTCVVVHLAAWPRAVPFR